MAGHLIIMHKVRMHSAVVFMVGGCPLFG